MPPDAVPQQQKQQTLDALVAWMLEEAERQPVLVAWEDLHWADPSTLEMLGLVLEQTPTVPMLHVLTFRPEFTPPWPSRSHLTPITLNRLERAQVEALITHLAGGKPLPAEVVQHIVAKTDGVPLYVEELTKMLLQSALLREDADHYTLTGPLRSVAIPDTLQDALMARLDQLHTAKEVAQVGAVLGREFAYEMLQALSSQDEATLQAGLAQLVGAELLYQRGRPPRATYTFKHALIQDAAYASLLRSTRQRVHQQMWSCARRAFPRWWRRSPRWWRGTAPPRARTRPPSATGSGPVSAPQGSAHAEAIAHLTQGLAVLTTLPETPARLQQELDLQVALGSGVDGHQGVCRPRRGTRLRPGAGAVCAARRHPATLPGAAGVDVVLSEPRGRTDGDATRGAGAPPGPGPARPGAPPARPYAGESCSGGASRPRRTHYTQALALYDPQAHRPGGRYGVDLGVMSHSSLARALWSLGAPDQALQVRRHAPWRRRWRTPEPGAGAGLCGRAASVAPRGTGGDRAGSSHHNPGDGTGVCAVGGPGYGPARLGPGHAGPGRGGYRCDPAGARRLSGHGVHAVAAVALGLLAEAYGAGGHPDEGLTALAEALAVLDTTELRYYAAELYRLKGTLLLQQAVPDAAQAAACFHQALDVARQQAKSWELRAATSLARLWQSQGKRQEAYALLAPVYEWFTEGFDTADLQGQNTTPRTCITRGETMTLSVGFRANACHAPQGAMRRYASHCSAF